MFRQVLFSLVLSLVPGFAAVGQEVIRPDSAVVCAQCEIVLEDPIELRGPFEGESVLAGGVVVRRAPDGWIYVVHEMAFGEVHVYSPDGSYSGRIGRPGAAPGEFNFITSLQVVGDTLHVFDSRLQRWTAMDRHRGSLISTAHVPRHNAAVVLGSGQTVLSGPVALRETAGYPLHVYSAQGSWERSFGLDEPRLRPESSFFHRRWMEPAGGGTFWAAPINEYRIELWRADGVLVRAFLPQRDWFAPWFDVALTSMSPDRPPPTDLAGISVDADGLLWVRFAVAAETWADGFTGEVNIEGSPVRRANTPYRVALIEVIDPGSGAVLARKRLEDRCCGLAGPNTFFRSWTDENGLPRLRIIPARLVGR